MSEQITNELVNGRRFPIGAERVPEKGVHFRIWAPERKTVKLVINSQGEELDPPNPPAVIELTLQLY